MAAPSSHIVLIPGSTEAVKPDLHHTHRYRRESADLHSVVLVEQECALHCCDEHAQRRENAHVDLHVELLDANLRPPPAVPLCSGKGGAGADDDLSILDDEPSDGGPPPGTQPLRPPRASSRLRKRRRRS